jgi:WD repeat-containing protein 23
VTPSADETDEFEEEIYDDMEDDEEEGTTLYFDAEEGTLRTANGDQIEITMDGEAQEQVEDAEEEEDEEGQGSQTPQPAAPQQQQQRAQTITSTFSTTTNDRPSLLTRLSSATQQRVSMLR